MTTPLSLDTEHRDGATVLTATGEIDLSNTTAFAAALTEAARGGRVTVDLRGVEYLDSGAVHVLFAHADSVRVLANPVLLPVLTVSGLTELVEVVAE